MQSAPQTGSAAKTGTIRHDLRAAMIALSILIAPWFFQGLAGTALSAVDLSISATLVLVLPYLLLGDRFDPWDLSPIMPVLIPGLLFSAVALLSGAIAPYVIANELNIGNFLSSTVQYTFIFVIMPFLALATMRVIVAANFIRIVAIAFLVPMIVNLAVAVIPVPLSLSDMFFFAARATGSYGNANTFALMISITFPFYVILALSRERPSAILGGTGVMVSLACLIAAGSFSGILVFTLTATSMVGAILVHPPSSSKDIRKRMVQLAGLATVGCTAMSAIILLTRGAHDQVKVRMLQVWEKIAGGVDTAATGFGSANLRMSLIDESISMISRYGGGLFGHGLGQSEAISHFGTDVHLLYLLLWQEGGLPLLLLYLSILVIMFRNTLASEMAPEVRLAVFCSLIAIALSGFTQTHMYLRFYWIPLLPAFCLVTPNGRTAPDL